MSSTKLIENEIQEFLRSKKEEIISISGHWGVGKTYAWNKYLNEAKKDNKISFKNYSYVSLFGINSLEDFKYSIFENLVNSPNIGVEPSLETMKTNTLAVAKRLGKKSIATLQQNPTIKSYIGGFSSFCFLFVKQALICIDDIERKGKNLDIRDVLGLISNLKEHKKCKVVIILNDGELGKDEEEFLKYFEKVVDVNLKFSPTPEECVEMALENSSPTNNLLGQYCIKLKITNIRIIKKIESIVEKIKPTIKELDQRVLDRAIESLTFLSWIVYDPKNAPSIQYLTEKKSDHFYGVKKNQTLSKEEVEIQAKWNTILDNYGFYEMDKFDRILLDGIQNGFFDRIATKQCASELEEQFKNEGLDDLWTKSWEMFYGSFDDNEQEVVDKIYQSFLESIQNRTTRDLNSTVRLLNDLGKQKKSKEILAKYIDEHSKNKKIFDLKNDYSGTEYDQDIKNAFEEKYNSLNDRPDVVTILSSISHGYHDNDLKILSELDIQEYIKIFKNEKDKNLDKIINGCLQFDKIANAKEAGKEISRKVKLALKNIGQESTLNALRIREYDIEINHNSIVSDIKENIKETKALAVNNV